MESNKAASLYTYEVKPNFYRKHVSKAQHDRPTNKRKSTRYSWLSFCPIACGLQFKKIVNIFYLITGILNVFKTIRVNKPLAILIPTALIMLLGVVKELIGELTRYSADKKVNATPVTRLALPGSKLYAEGGRDLKYERTCLANVKVGDIIKIDDETQVPADCILLKVADNKPECFVKTAALDGERNLKPKLANEKISSAFD